MPSSAYSFRASYEEEENKVVHPNSALELKSDDNSHGFTAPKTRCNFSRGIQQ